MKNLVFTYFIVFVLAALGLARKSSGQELAPLIAAAAKRHAVPVRVLVAVLEQESSMGKADLSKSGDLGVAQISPRTADWLGFDKRRLVADNAYNIDCAAQILARLKKKWAKKEPTNWYSRYHSNTLHVRFRYQLALSGRMGK